MSDHARLRELRELYSLDAAQARFLYDLEELHERIKSRDLERQRSEALLDVLDEDVSVSTVACALGVTRATLYRWMDGDNGK